MVSVLDSAKVNIWQQLLFIVAINLGDACENRFKKESQRSVVLL